MTSLQHLGLERVHFSTADVLHLSSLTALTSIWFSSCPAVKDTVLCALAVRLTNLVSLGVWECGLASAASLPVLATLTKLSSLDLTGERSTALSDTELMLLSTLTGLHSLTLPLVNSLTDAGTAAFLQRMPHLEKVLFC